MNTSHAVALVLCLSAIAHAQTLDLPPRPANAPTGTAFASSIAALSLKDREAKVRAEFLAGNVPPFLRTLVPVTVSHEANRATYDVTADYLAIGSDEDYFLTPLTPSTAQAIADRLGCTLPTPRMVDQIYTSAGLKLSPAPFPPSPAMTTVPLFLRHNERIAAQRGGRPLGTLVAGHKKDVVISNQAFATPGKVVIYGWHQPNGKPIQPLYTGHAANWVDYSHGIRLVRRQMTVNGAAKSFDSVLADPRLAPLLSDEGVMRQTRYPTEDARRAKPSSSSQSADDETTEEFRIDAGVRVVISRPKVDPMKPALLVLYALPNGNTIEQTIGKATAAGDDWHFDIQHIGAQTRFLRAKLPERALSVAYVENDLKSWPAWRKKHGNDGIAAIVDTVRDRLREPRAGIVLSGHSGGGSLIFGYIDHVPSIPDQVERIVLLDANYGYDTARHTDKLTAWLKSSPAHHLVVLAYNDAVALLDGKPFVSATGGTWGRSHAMLADLQRVFPLTKSKTGDVERTSALGGRITFLLIENPERKVLHTVQVERNGFIEGLLAGTRREGAGYTYFGERAYVPFIKAD